MELRKTQNPARRVQRAENESSLLFSLESLLDVERERIDRERAEQEQRLLEARRQRELAEQRAREAEQVRLQEEQRREAERQQRAREEAARLEGIRLAELERVRLETAHRSQLELAARRQEHEAQLAALAQSSGRKRARIGLALVAATGAVGAVAVALYFKQFQARNAALDLERTRLIAEINALAATATGKIDDANRANQELQELIRERDELRRARATNAAPHKAPDKSPSRPTPAAVKPPKPDNKPCDPDDPMAGCLPLKR